MNISNKKKTLMQQKCNHEWDKICTYDPCQYFEYSCKKCDINKNDLWIINNITLMK